MRRHPRYCVPRETEPSADKSHGRQRVSVTLMRRKLSTRNQVLQNAAKEEKAQNPLYESPSKRRSEHELLVSARWDYQDLHHPRGNSGAVGVFAPEAARRQRRAQIGYVVGELRGPYTQDPRQWWGQHETDEGRPVVTSGGGPGV